MSLLHGDRKLAPLERYSKVKGGGGARELALIRCDLLAAGVRKRCQDQTGLSAVMDS